MSRHWKTAKNPDAIILDWTYYVEVCSFTFYFRSLEQIEEYRAYYARKIHPSSADGAERNVRYWDKTINGGCWQFGHNRGDHWDRRTEFDRLPLYLREEPKRLRVVKALERALKQWRAENDKP